MDWKKKFKFVAIVAAFAVLIMIVLSNIFQTTRISEKDIRTYQQGLSYFNQKDFENAYFNFNNVSKNSAIYEIALYRQALCADELNDFDTATKKYRMFLEKFPESLFAQKANYSLAQNYFRVKDYTKSEKIFNNLRKDFKDSDYAKASNYYLGMIYKNKSEDKNTSFVQGILGNEEKDEVNLKEKAKSYFLQYLQDSPTGRYSMNSADELLSLNLVFTTDEYSLIGRTYFKNGSYNKAYDVLAKGSAKKSWGYWAEVNKKRGEYKAFRDIVEKYYPLHSQNVDKEDLQMILSDYASLCKQGPKQGWYKLLELAQTTNAEEQDYILFKLLKYVDKSEQKTIQERIYREFPKGNFSSNVLASLFWDAYKNKDYKTAYQCGLIHIRDYQNTIAAPKILFWMGKLADKFGRRNEAKTYYQRILDNYPDDYYAFRAAKQIKYTPNNGWKTKSSHKLPEKTQWVTFPVKHLTTSPDKISTINTILRLGDYKLLGEIDKDNKVIQSWLLYKEGQYATSATIARDYISEMQTKPSFDDDIFKLAYQLHYQDIINDNAKIYRLDPYFVTALIREESYFNPEAGSSVGARGLMQLMPATAYFIAQRNGISYLGANDLINPKTNIRLGCAYFDYAKERLHEDDMLATASYNGGPNAVAYWKDNLEYKNFDEFIENIPYPETRDYVKKVYRSYWVYLNVY